MDFHVRYNKIGLKHDFLCINIWWAPKVALKPESVKKGFQSPKRHIRCLCSSKACSIAVIRLLHKEMFD